MFALIIFAFLAGIVTVLSPCILPVLPLVLSSSVSGGKRRPFGVVLGFILSFTLFTLFLTSLVKILGISSNTLRGVSIVIIFLFGLSLLLPGFQAALEKLFSKLSGLLPKTNAESGFVGGLFVGTSIGIIWTPCVGPILGSVISLAVTGTVTGTAFFITLAYSLGTAIPMLAIVYGGRGLLNRVPWLTRNTGKIQKIFGVIMMLTAIGIYFNLDRDFQSFVLDRFPNYGTGLTQIEENSLVENGLQELKGNSVSFNKEDMGKPMSVVLPDLGEAPELIPGGEWFNTQSELAENLPDLSQRGMALESLRGRVVLVDFWTYTCINCIRTLPYLKSWDEKYRDDGLVIIGVHTPEFDFEKDADNVKEAIQDFDLKYPIMQDNDYATWRAYENHYWPAKYLIDKDGNIRYTHFGEGDYDETENNIQKLLEETGKKVSVKVDNPKYSVSARTPETYLGYGRMQFFQTPSQLKKDVKKEYESLSGLDRNYFSFDGVWEVGEEYAIPEENAVLMSDFEAKEVHIVMRPKDEGKTGRVKVYLDGNVVKEAAGDEVEDGVVVVDTDKLYNLINLNQSGHHTLKLEFLDSNVEIFAFTFG
jgi:cytochrome c biogenesis protein CcdA/thiol-disulfide isomerase/thioredoxin